MQELVRVKNNLVVSRKNGSGKVRVINVIHEDGLSTPLWINDVSAHSEIKTGDEVGVVRTNRGYKLADEQQQPALSVVKTLPTNTKSPITDNDLNDWLLDVEEKRKLMALIQQNAKVLNHCIKTVKQEVEDINDRKDLKSLGVTLFISISHIIKK